MVVNFEISVALYLLTISADNSLQSKSEDL